MSKICPNCNINYSNSAVKCVTCGSPLVLLEMPKKKKSIIISLIITAAILVIAAITTITVVSLTGPRGKVRYIMNNLKKNDIDAVLDTVPDFLLDPDLEYKDDILIGLTTYTDNMSGYIFSFNTNKCVTPSTSQITELKQSIQSIVGENFDTSKIEDVKMVWVDIRGGTFAFWNSSDARFVMIKYNDEWHWWPYY